MLVEVMCGGGQLADLGLKGSTTGWMIVEMHGERHLVIWCLLHVFLGKRACVDLVKHSSPGQILAMPRHALHAILAVPGNALSPAGCPAGLCCDSIFFIR